MYQVTREVEFGDLKVTVRELTVAEVRRWMNETKPDQDEKEFDMFLDLLSFDGIGINEIYLFTDLKKEMMRQQAEDARARMQMEARMSMNESDNQTAKQLAALEVASG